MTSMPSSDSATAKQAHQPLPAPRQTCASKLSLMVLSVCGAVDERRWLERIAHVELRGGHYSCSPPCSPSASSGLGLRTRAR